MIKGSYPLMGDYKVPIEYLLRHALKVKVISPPPITTKTIEIGSKYSPEFVCTPFKYTLGTMIESIEKGANTIIQFGGGCRYGYYGEVQKQILQDLNYDVIFANLITKGKTSIKRIIKEIKKINPKFSKLKAIYYTFITIKMVEYMDTIDDYIRENIGFEENSGSFEELKFSCLKEFSNIKGYFDLRKKYRYYSKEFEKLKIHKPDNCLKVGIIGELYTIMEPFSNYFLEKTLAKNHIEIKRFTNVHYLLFEKSKKVPKYLKYAKEYIKYPMGADAADNIARTKYLCEENYDGIIHIKSSFCTPEIGAMPIISKIANNYNVPVLFFSFDAATSEVGIKTRLEAFYDMLEMRKTK
ncbi:MAG: 2-hydroxyacyl-CoA dehydratase [Bacilli bacterium]|nr:2-hydroxyacyl-CoA dehydratase [Bacilli bacterium]